jgi:hypothetical protein
MTATVATECDLRAALAVGGTITVDPSAVLDLAAPLSVTVPGTRVTGGRYRAASGVAFLVSADDVALLDLDVEGGQATDATYDPTQRLVHAVGQPGAPLHRVVVRGCTLRQTRGHGVWLDWCVDSSVRDCHIGHVTYSGVMVLSGLRVVVEGNHVAAGPANSAMANSYGVAFTDGTNDEAGRSRDCAAIGNVVRGFTWKGLDTHSGDGVIFADNTVIDCVRGIAAVAGNTSRLVPPSRVSVVANRIDSRGLTDALHAVVLTGLQGKPADGLITGNQVVGQEHWLRLEHVDRGRCEVAANSRPMVEWTDLDMTGADFFPNANYPPEIMADGGIAQWRGGVVPKSSGAELVGRLPHASLYPAGLTWVAYTRGTNAASGGGMLTVYPDGTVRMLYRHGTDTYTRPLVGSWRTV